MERPGLVEQLARPVQRDLPERQGLRVPPALRVRKVLKGLQDLRVRQVLRGLQGRQARLVPPELLALRGQLALRARLDLLVRQVQRELVLLVLQVLQARRVRQAQPALLVAERVVPRTSGFRLPLGFPAPLRGVVLTPWKQPPTR